MGFRSITGYVLSGLWLFFLVIGPSSGSASTCRNVTEPGGSSTCELTRTPLADYDSLTPDDLTVLGIKLGMSQISVKKAIATKKRVYFRQDRFFNSRLYLYEYLPDEQNQRPLAYFKWDENSRKLQEILIYPGFAKYMPAANDYLVSKRVLQSVGGDKGLKLGQIREEEALLDVPSQQIRHTAFYFIRPGFRSIKQVKGSRTWYAFSWFRTDKTGTPLAE